MNHIANTIYDPNEDSIIAGMTIRRCYDGKKSPLGHETLYHTDTGHHYVLTANLEDPQRRDTIRPLLPEQVEIWLNQFRRVKGLKA